MDNKKDIKDYSIDYRNNNVEDFKSYKNATKTVVASSPGIHKLKDNRDISNKKGTSTATCSHHIKKTVNSVPVNDVYIPIRSPKNIIYRVIFGCFILFLTIAGVIIFLSSLNRTACTVSVDTPILDNYSNFLTPIVMHDPLPFNCPKDADPQMVISSAIWRAITQNGTQKYNSFDEKGFSLIPVNDITDACYYLFGPDCKINTNEQIFGPFFSFTPGDEYFHISAVSNQDSYIAYIKDSIEEPEFLVLTVGYISRDDAFFNSAPKKAAEPTPVKCMKYKLKTNEKTGNPYIFAVENVT